jgi:hypothetical protein
MSKYFMYGFAGLAAFFALGMWYTFLRPAETKLATGVITNKTFKPAGEYAQYPAGLNRGSFYGPNRIPIAECYILIIHVDDLAADVGYAANVPEAETYEVGQHLSIRYQTRGIPGIWRKVFVLGLSR